jgi:Spy/CpxP family protein refolding chaperone
MKKMLLAAAAVAVVGLAAPVAHADDNAYIAYLRSMKMGGGSDWEGQILAIGNLQCEQMMKGRDEISVYRDLHDTGMSNAESSNVVYAAHHYLCPNAPVAFHTSYPKL